MFRVERNFTILFFFIATLRVTFSTIRSKTKTNCEGSRVFPRFARLHVFASSADWFIEMFTPVMIGQSNTLPKVHRTKTEQARFSN